MRETPSWPMATAGRRACIRALGMAAAALGTAGGSLAECGSAAAQLAATASTSVWQEYDDTDQRLLREEGVLRGIALQASGRCGEHWVWSAGALHEAGRRKYAGRTNRGRPIDTSSEVATQSAGVRIGRELGPIRISVGAARRWTRRDLAPVGPVLGYTERYRFDELDLGISGLLSLPGDAVLDVELLFGWAPAGHLRVDLPGAEPIHLRTGQTNRVEVAAMLAAPWPALAPDASWQIGLVATRRNTAAGPFAPVRRQGVVTGSARQPKMRQECVTLAFALEWAF